MSIIKTAGFILIICAVVSMFVGNSYMVYGTVEDFFIPHNIAYAIKQGLTLHESFHTFFGWIYGGINYNALLLIEYFPQVFEYSDLVLLSSVIFSLVIFSLFLMTYIRVHKMIKPVPLFVLLIILPLIFQVRDVAEWDHKKLYWYGIYNYHLWSLLFLQITHLFCWESYLRKKPQASSIVPWDIMFFSFIQAIILYITFHYKISFFISSAFASFAIIFLMNNKTKLHYVIYILSFLIIFVFTTALHGYSYIGYIEDIYHAMEAKRTNTGVQYLSLVLYLSVYVIIIFFYRFYKLGESRIFSKSRNNIFITVIKDKQNIKYFSFDLFIAFSLFFGELGSYNSPFIFILLAAVFFILINPKDNSNKVVYSYIPRAIVFMFFFINIAAMIRVAEYKSFENSNSKYIQKTISGFDEKTSIQLVIRNEGGLQEIYNYLQFGEHHDKENIILDMSYSYNPLGFGGFPYTNTDYLTAIEENTDVIKELDIKTSDKIMMLGYIDPFPVLLNTKFSTPSYHWIHLQNTFTYTQLNRLYPAYNHADIIVMPAVIRKTNQTIVNCTFYLWNFENGMKFRIFKISQNSIYFTKNKNLQRYNLTEHYDLNKKREQIIERCRTDIIPGFN